MKRFFSFDPEDGFERHETEDLARARAEKCLARDRDIATTEGWPEEVEGICWGEIRERVAETWRHEVTDDDDVPTDCDEMVDYGLGAVEEDEEESIERPGRIGRIARDLGNCAEAWEADACLLGNVTAEEIRDLCQWVITHNAACDLRRKGNDELGTPGEYERDDEQYEYVEQKHMIIYPSKSAGWEQIVRRDGSVGKPSFYVWRRLQGYAQRKTWNE